MLKKGYNFYFCTYVPVLNFFLTPRSTYSIVLRGVSFLILKLEYLSKIETELENALTCLSEAQMGSNDEKNWGSKILLD